MKHNIRVHCISQCSRNENKRRSTKANVGITDKYCILPDMIWEKYYTNISSVLKINKNTHSLL